MELLERGHALAALADAHASAKHGEGRAVFVNGEPGIGKTSLVARFLEGLEPGSRVLVGACDDLSIPRPLGPFRDFAARVSPQLSRALATGAAPYDIQALLVEELELPPHPTVLVLEDVHWADEATFDSLTVLGRRVGSLPALLVITFRDGEVPPGHPLHATIGAVPADHAVFLELAPLSHRAVATLAGDRADGVYAATRGNPFYVTELLACSSEKGLPQSVANAVRGRASRLDHPSRVLLELVSVVPKRVPVSVLDDVMSNWAAAAEEPERRRLLEVEAGYVRFRHELARHAIASSMTAAARRRVHAGILAALLEAGADPAEIVHHAEAAAPRTTSSPSTRPSPRDAPPRSSRIARRSPTISGLRTSPTGSRRPRRRLSCSSSPRRRTSSRASTRHSPPSSARSRSIATSATGDRSGKCMRVLSRFHWFSGDGRTARRTAQAAVAILEPLGESTELAAAYSTVSQLAMLGEDTSQAIAMGEIAYELATQLGDDATRAHALVNIGSSKIQLDPGRDGDAARGARHGRSEQDAA